MGDPQEMVRQAKNLAEATSALVNAIRRDAENESDPDARQRLLDAAKSLADATSKMVEAAKMAAKNPNVRERGRKKGEEGRGGREEGEGGERERELPYYQVIWFIINISTFNASFFLIFTDNFQLIILTQKDHNINNKLKSIILIINIG